MVHKTRREMEMLERISELEEKLQSYSVTDVQAKTEGVHKRDASVVDEEEEEEFTLPQHEGYISHTTVQVATEEGGHKSDTDVMEKISHLNEEKAKENVEEVEQEKNAKGKEEEEEKAEVSLPRHDGYSDATTQTEEELGPLLVSDQFISTVP